MEKQITNLQLSNLNRASNVTSAQIELVNDLLMQMHLNPTPENRLAMLQVLATNYMAERTKT